MNSTFRRLLGLAIIAALLPISVFFPAQTLPVRAHQLPSQGGSASVDDPVIVPLPRGCLRGMAPGQDPVACCVNGFVYLDGQPVAGALVEVESPRGERISALTRAYRGEEQRPYYQLGLSNAPLEIAIGETITLTASYGDQQRSLTYTVRAEGQQIDLVLARRQASDYRYAQQIQGPPDPGRFNLPQGLALNSLGELYVVDVQNALVQVLGPDGGFLRSFGEPGNLPGQFNRPSAIAIDQSDNVYVADSDNHRVQKFSRHGFLIDIFGGAGSPDVTLSSPGGLALDTYGSLYVSDSDNHRVLKLSAGGELLAAWGELGSANGQFNRPGGLAIDGQGWLYVLDRLNHRVQRFSLQGEWQASWGGFGSLAGQFNRPWGIAVDQSGNLLVSDSENHRVQKLTTAGGAFSWQTEPDPQGGLFSPTGLATDGQGRIYVADSGNSRLQLYDADGGWLAVWGGYSSADGQLARPAGLAVAPDGSTYVADTHNHRIQKFGPDGSWLAAWGELGSGQGQLSYPSGIALDAQGQLYVADTGNDRIQKFDAQGSWLGGWGGLGSADGQLSTPYSLALDAQGRVYVADTGNNRVQKFEADGSWLVSWGGFGSANGQLKAPAGVALGAGGDVYVLDKNNQRVQRFTSAGVWLASWGGFGSANGQLSAPNGIAAGADGSIFVADTLNSRAQQFGGSGAWRANLGRGGNAAGLFDRPAGIAAGPGGSLYVADTHNQRVQIFQPMIYTLPIATITYLSGPVLRHGGSLTLAGMGQDSDETPGILEYDWSSDVDGPIITGTASLSLASGALSPGSHQITLRVRDDEGEWSAPASAQIYVEPPPEVAWTMLLYLAGDYHDRGRMLNLLERPLEQLRQSFGNQELRIAVQIDGPANSDTRRLLISPGTPPQVLDIPMAEVGMDDPARLAEFIAWGQSSFPAQRYYLAIAGLGQAVQGLGGDYDGATSGEAYMTVRELGQALGAEGLAPIDLLQLDASSLGLLEAAYELRGRARALIASQYLVWNYFVYEEYQAELTAQRSTAEVARRIVALYGAHAQADGYPYTLSAISLERAEPVLAGVDELAGELAALIENGALSRAQLDQIWLDTQRFESNGDGLVDQQDFYLDLLDWTERVSESVALPAVRARASALLAELARDDFVLANAAHSAPLPARYGGAQVELSQANGLSIFYPLDQRGQALADYLGGALFSFTAGSRWPDFLTAGLGALPAPDQPLPGLLAPLDTSRLLYLPLLRS